MRKIAWIATLVAGMVGIASAEKFYIDFYDNGTVNTATETYNVMHSAAGNGAAHPIASINSGLSVTALVDTDNIATGVDAHLVSYNNDGATAAGGGSIAIGEISGIATNASQDAFFCNDKGTAGSDFGFVLTFSNLTGDAYNISLLTATTSGGGTWSVTTGAGDASVQAYLGTGATSNTLDWTSVVPNAGTIQLTSVNTNPNSWKNVWLAFASLEAVSVVGTPPTADAISTNVVEDGSVDITLSGDDIDGDDLTYHILSMPANGTLTTNGVLPNVTYTPDANFVGSDSFTYFVNDGVFDSAAATVSITVDPGNNDAPVADDLDVSVSQNGSIEITLSGTDPEGSNLTYSISQPAHGTVTTNVALPDVTYTPDANYFGDDSFTYTVNDGAQDSAPATVSIEVLEVGSIEGVIYVDFGTEGAAITAPETYNSLEPAFGANPSSLAGSGQDFTGLLYADGDASGVDLNFHVASSGGDVRANDQASAHDVVTGIDAGATDDGFWMNNGTVPGTLTFTLTYTGLSGAAYDLFLVPGPTGRDVVWDVITGTGDDDTFTFTTATDTTDTAEWTDVAPVDGEIVLTGTMVVTGGSYISTRVNFMSLREVGPPTSVGDISIEVVSDGTEVALTWATVAGWDYGVKTCGNLAVGDWSGIITNGVPGTGGEVTITNPVSTGPEFYRAYLDNE